MNHLLLVFTLLSSSLLQTEQPIDLRPSWLEETLILDYINQELTINRSFILKKDSNGFNLKLLLDQVSIMLNLCTLKEQTELKPAIINLFKYYHIAITINEYNQLQLLSIMPINNHSELNQKNHAHFKQHKRKKSHVAAKEEGFTLLKPKKSHGGRRALKRLKEWLNRGNVNVNELKKAKAAKVISSKTVQKDSQEEPINPE